MKYVIITLIIIAILAIVGFIFWYSKTTTLKTLTPKLDKTRELTPDEQQAVTIAWQEILRHYPNGEQDGKKLKLYNLIHSLNRNPSVVIVFSTTPNLDKSISIEVDITTKSILNYSE